ncbi:MAG: hypothetical protein ACYTHJ_20430, partial [Planctomycetota bacterium]
TELAAAKALESTSRRPPPQRVATPPIASEAHRESKPSKSRRKKKVNSRSSGQAAPARSKGPSCDPDEPLGCLDAPR